VVTVEQVEWWAIEGGIGHAVASTNAGNTHWIETACNMLGNFRHLSTARPARICRACRERLKTATIAGER